MKRIVAAIALATLFAFPLAAATCAPSLQAIEFHAGKHGQTVIESREGPLPDNPDFVVQWSLWLNEDSGVWAVTATANGITCLFAAGGNYSGKTLDDLLLGEAA